MPEIKIMSIQNLLHIEGLHNNNNIAIVFVTTKPDYYAFTFTFYIHLNIADTDEPVIDKKAINSLKLLLDFECKYYSTIYVCCDAGLSRSPAVALFLACKLSQFEQAEEIEKKYRFLNQALYKKLMEAM